MEASLLQTEKGEGKPSGPYIPEEKDAVDSNDSKFTRDLP